jgi:nicotinamidase-related amidase
LEPDPIKCDPMLTVSETPNMLISAARAQVLMIDMQERLLPAMHDPAETERRCGLLLTAAATLGLPVTASEQYPKGLGATVPALRKQLGNAPIFDKLAFSALSHERLADRLKDTGRAQVIVCGIEAHVCVLQTAADLLSQGYEVFIAADAVSSRAPTSVTLALDRLRNAGAAIVNSEMVVFEGLKKAGTPEFKALSAAIK